MKNKSVAKRYAVALFNIAKEENNITTFGQELNAFTTALVKDGLKEILTPVYPSKFRSDILDKILEKAQLKNILNSFIKLLFNKDRLSLIEIINKHYQNLADKENNITKGTISSAIKLDSNKLLKIEQALSELVGKKVELEIKVDSNLIGGLKAQLGDISIDGSIVNQINQITNTFNI